MKIAIFALMFLLILFLFFSNLKPPGDIGIYENKLVPCAWTPNCVSSDAIKTEHAIPPLPNISDDTLTLIENFLKKNYRAEVIKKMPDYLYIVISTPFFRFRDDLEFLIDDENNTISVRSASRVGYSDLNKNRERIEKLRAYLNVQSSKSNNDS